MRTGLIPQVVPATRLNVQDGVVVSATSEPLTHESTPAEDLPTIGQPPAVASVLDRIHAASGRGDAAEVVRLTEVLKAQQGAHCGCAA